VVVQVAQHRIEAPRSAPWHHGDARLADAPNFAFALEQLDPPGDLDVRVVRSSWVMSGGRQSITTTVSPWSAMLTARCSALGDTSGDSITTSAPEPRPRGIRPSSTRSVDDDSTLAMTSSSRRRWRRPVAGGSRCMPRAPIISNATRSPVLM
jgi:hypothetical protein